MRALARGLTFLVLAAMLVGGPAGPPAQAATGTAPATVTIVNGSLQIWRLGGEVGFGTATLTGNDVILPQAASSPTFRITDGTGSGGGWHVSFQATDFSDGTGTIPATNFSFTATGGILSKVDVTSQDISPTGGPTETGQSGNLAAGLTVVRTNVGFGKGTYDYAPAATSFRLVVPGATRRGTGTFVSTLTASVLSGP